VVLEESQNGSSECRSAAGLQCSLQTDRDDECASTIVYHVVGAPASRPGAFLAQLDGADGAVGLQPPAEATADR